MSIIGVAAVSAGNMSLALEQQRMKNTTFIPALFTGVTIALYTVVDGLGVRAWESSTTYTVWIFLTWSLMWCVVYLSRTLATPTASPMSRQIILAGAGGLVSILAYGIVIWALQFDSMGMVSALRETSVLFAALIGRFFLGERLTVTRVVSGITIVAGVILLVAGLALRAIPGSSTFAKAAPPKGSGRRRLSALRGSASVRKPHPSRNSPMPMLFRMD